LAARKSGALFLGSGHNSTTSKPTMFFLLDTALNNAKTSYHNNPPGSGVPVEGMIEMSKTSKSIVM
jgi:hypothetical protein